MYKEALVVQAEYDRILVAVRATLGEEVFATALAKGRALTLEQAITLALANAVDDAHDATARPE
jgi:hypothetical protein